MLTGSVLWNAPAVGLKRRNKHTSDLYITFTFCNLIVTRRGKNVISVLLRAITLWSLT